MDEDYSKLTERLDKVLDNLPGKLVAIDGRDGSGKSTLGRYLAYKYNVSLIETDLFLHGECNPPKYFENEINRIIVMRLSIPRPVIVEGIAIMELLGKISVKPDFVVYVENLEFEGGSGLQSYLRAYENKHNPKSNADVVLSLKH